MFLCGTGISAPQLPDFRTLVDRIYERLGVEKSPSQALAYDRERFEEVLGSLSRDLANPSEMLDAAAALLTVPAEPDLGQVGTIARLSRDLSNRVLVVTTNFDTLLERALHQSDPQLDAASISFAGQALPPPGGADFSGIIHIHGRLVDPELALGATPLVLTSSDYGDAYMRSGWASRFLFDLARCKTIVLVGYSANDAPVRYFLNVLEADRSRFPDLRRIYAFDSYEVNSEQAELPWGTVAVTPIAYCCFDPVTGVRNHSPLWNDLRELADLAERPKATREARARRIMSEPSIDATDADLRELRWLFTETGDLIPTAIGAIVDARWFDVLADNQFWREEDARWAIPAWIARDFARPERLALAAVWQSKLGPTFNTSLEGRLRQAGELTPFYRKAWRLILAGNSAPRGDDDGAFAIEERIKSGLILASDLRAAIDWLIPRPTLRPRRPLETGDAEEAGEPTRFADVIWADFSVPEAYHAQEIINLLKVLPDRADEILDIATGALARATAEAADFEEIAEDYDTSDFAVPSIEDHEQNEHHNSTPFLIRALVDAYDRTAADAPEYAKTMHARWWRMPGRLGKRLTLHALRDKRTATGDEAFDAILALDDGDFWSIRREIALLLEHRAADASPAFRATVETRIIETGEAYYKRYTVEEGQADWRQHARDTEVRLRLTALDTAGVLSPEGKTELDAIRARYEYLDREIEDRDYFHSYSSGVRMVVGDTEPIVEAAPDDRLEVVHKLVQSHDIERQQGWHAYCRSDPRGAYQTLAAADFSEPNLKLWNVLLAALSFSDKTEAEKRADVIVDAMGTLWAAEPAQIALLAQALADVLYFGPRDRIANLEDWCDRIWNALQATEEDADFSGDVHSMAINRGSGRLAQALLRELSSSIEAGSDLLPRQMERLRSLASAPGGAGTFARVIFAESIAYLLRTIRPLVETDLAPRMEGPSDEAQVLRRVMIAYGSVTPEISMLIPDIIELAVEESAPSGHAGESIAAQFVRPAIAQLRADETHQWGIDAPRAARMLRRAPDMVRTGALSVLGTWMKADDAGPEAGWDGMAEPFFQRIWPKESKYVVEAQNQHLIAIAVGAGGRFPVALRRLRWYFKPVRDRRPSLHAIKASTAPEAYPHETLDLLWTLIGPAGPTGYDLADLLDRIKAAEPGLEVDRRLQSLDQRAFRFS